MAKSHLLHEMEEYLYLTLQKLVVGRILHILLSDHRATRGQTAKKVKTTFNSNF
jgi:hypothetical protein